MKSRALPPMAACKGSPIESSLRRMADLPKLATRRKGDAEVKDGGLTGQLKHWATSLSKLTPNQSIDPKVQPWRAVRISRSHRRREPVGASARRGEGAVGEPS